MNDGGLGRSSNRRAILAAALLATTTMAGVAFSAPAQAQATAARSFDIPAQPLPAALTIFGRQSGLQVSVPAALANGRTSSAVAGDLTPLEALSRLLTGTGLVYRISGNIVTLEPAPQSANGAIELGPVRVEGTSSSSSGYSASLTSDPAATEGTGSYTATGPSSTATGLALTLRETPQSVTVVTRQKMDDFGQTTVEQVLEQTPGLSLYREGNYTQLIARGQTVTNFQSDGVRNQDYLAYKSSQSVYTFANNPLFGATALYDRIEVLKGSSGLMNGDGSPGATVNMVRKKPTHSFQAYAQAGLGSWDEYSLEGDISGPLTTSGNLRARVVGAWQDADSYKNYVNNKDILVYGTVDFDVSGSTILNVGAQYEHHKNTGSSINNIILYSADGISLGETPRSFNLAAPWNKYTQETISIFGTLEQRISDDWKAVLKVGLTKNDSPENIIFAVWPLFLDGRIYITNNETKSVDLNISGSVNLFGRNHDIFIGASASDYEGELMIRRLSSEGSASYYVNGNTVTDYTSGWPSYYDAPSMSYFYQSRLINTDVKTKAVFASGRFNILDQLKLIAGFRVSDYVFDENLNGGITSLREHGVFLPYGGILYDVSKAISLYGSYASIFQPQMYYRDINDNLLPPEEGDTFEFGAKAALFNSAINVSAAYFIKRTNNTAEATGETTPSGNYAYRAVTGVSSHGYELEIGGRLLPNLEIQGSYVMNDSGLTDRRLPKNQIKMSASYEVVPTLSLGANVRWQDKTYSGLGELYYIEQNAFLIADVMVRYKFSYNAQLQANVNNITDKKYFSGMTSATLDGGSYTWGSPRSVSLSLRYKF